MFRVKSAATQCLRNAKLHLQISFYLCVIGFMCLFVNGEYRFYSIFRGERVVIRKRVGRAGPDWSIIRPKKIYLSIFF